MKKAILGGIAAVAVAGGLALAAPAQASETISICPDGFTGVAEGMTSCAFAHNVGVGVYRHGIPIVDTYSPVTEEVYQMQCSAGFEVLLNNGRTLTADRCVGGNNAVVWVW
jgi:hypothetical protein